MSIQEEEKFNIEKKLKGFSQQNSVVIVQNHNKKKLFNNFKVFSIYEFCEYIIRKSPLIFYPQTLSDTSGIYIINSLIKEIFKKNPTLFNLTKSSNFSKELYRLFGVFLTTEITPENLVEFLNTADNIEDKERFELITETYKKYLTKLNELDYVDRRDLCRYTGIILNRYPKYLEKVKKDFINIIIDISGDCSLIQTRLLQQISDNILELQTDNFTNNPLALSLLEKYLPEKHLTVNTQSSKSRLIEFADMQDEAYFIANEITEKVKIGQYKHEDFKIVLNNKSVRKTFLDVFRLSNIPTNINITDNDYQNFLTELTRYLNICNCLNLLSNSSLLKAESERMLSKINADFENIISETFENRFVKDKFLSIQQSTKEPSLINCVKKNLGILNTDEIQKIKNKLNKIETLTDLFNKGNIVDFIVFTTKCYNDKSTEFQENLATLIKKINNLEQLSFKLNKTLPVIEDIIEIINAKTPDKTENNGVRFVDFKNSNRFDCKEIYIPNLTEKTLPDKTHSTQFLSQDFTLKITEFVKSKYPNSGSIYPDNIDLIKQSAEKLSGSIFSTQNLVTLSTHKYEDKKQIVPSIFFQYLKTAFPQFIYKQEKTSTEKEGNKPVCANITDLKNEIVINNDDIIKLNPTAISSFQACPRKYYFKHLLGLKETGTFSATYGTIVHAIMETFNSRYLRSYSKETLLDLTEKLFNSATNPGDALSAGFKNSDIERITATDLLSLEEMKTQFESAIEELAKQSFFENIPDEIISEKSFTFTIKELPNIVFDGRIDAIYRFGSEYQIVDFKTGKTKPELSYLISENGVSFKTKTGKSTNEETKQNEYEYQIPLYYLACVNAAELNEFKNKISELGLLYIRPANKEEGVKKDFIGVETIETYLPQIIQNLNDTIIAKIRNREYFQSKYNEINCKNCSFKYLCDTTAEAEDEDE